ncbi:MAG TPA: alpha/beta hydrolase [Blastocatellia bacterium]|nr:alpha/beta hydrolase [Blastocatellia bacterium]
MPVATIHGSPLVPDRESVEVYYREFGAGIPLVFLHGGWGYGVYPFDSQIDELKNRLRILIPDRSGYGRSSRLPEFPVDFHRRAAGETVGFLDALGIEKAVFWGHSDGAVIGAKIGLAAPERVAGLILEAFHFYRVKPGSEGFFRSMVVDPAQLGDRIVATLAEDHGPEDWQRVIVNNGTAWAQLASTASSDREDLYDGRLNELSVPVLFIHGARDPRTEPEELSAVRQALPEARFLIIEEGKHSPHSESAAAQQSTRAAREFVDSLYSL